MKGDLLHRILAFWCRERDVMLELRRTLVTAESLLGRDELPSEREANGIGSRRHSVRASPRSGTNVHESRHSLHVAVIQCHV